MLQINVICTLNEYSENFCVYQKKKKIKTNFQYKRIFQRKKIKFSMKVKALLFFKKALLIKN